MKTAGMGAAIALAATCVGGEALAQTSRTFGNWTAVCDNVRTCVAYAGGEAGGWGYLLIGREAGPAAQPTLAIGGGVGGEGGPAAGPIRVRVDGRERFTAARQAGAGETPTGSLEGRAARTAIEAMRNGQLADIVTGGETVEISLAGSAAALLWIDERQGRMRNVTAMASRGPGPASAVPRAPPPPRVRGADVSGRAPPTALPAAVSRLPEVRACLVENGDLVPVSESLTVVPLASGGWLWGVPCGQGAYNFTTSWWSTDRQGRGPRPFAWPTSDGRETELVNASYSREEGSVQAFARGRGLGDCGVIQAWVLTATGPALIEERVMGVCSGVSPELWPSTYTAEVVER